jgi:hypothetical protein
MSRLAFVLEPVPFVARVDQLLETQSASLRARSAAPIAAHQSTTTASRPCASRGSRRAAASSRSARLSGRSSEASMVGYSFSACRSDLSWGRRLGWPTRSEESVAELGQMHRPECIRGGETRCMDRQRSSSRGVVFRTKAPQTPRTVERVLPPPFNQRDFRVLLFGSDRRVRHTQHQVAQRGQKRYQFATKTQQGWQESPMPVRVVCDGRYWARTSDLRPVEAVQGRNGLAVLGTKRQ